MQGINSLVGGPVPVADTADVTSAPAASRSDPGGTAFGSSIAGLFAKGRSTNAVTDGSEWLVGMLVVASLLFLISLRVGGFTSIIVEG